MRVAAAAEPDPRRIAVLPFRVTTADSLLGEGLAELVATEFTGESGPRAVNMGTVLRAWRGAGGGLRSPLAQDRAARLAREVGAARYVEGSVVGLGQRLTINASVVPVTGGDARRVAPISGTADSLDVLVGRLTSGLLAAAGADRTADSRTRLTDSPAAMRAYLEGLAHWRASRLGPAAAAFERAFAEDSLFARAAFMRWSVGQWGVPAPGWNLRVLALRERLSAQDQLLITGPLGTGVPRSRAEGLAARQRAADQLPESAEAQYFLGDWLYHYGTSLDINDHLERARVAFERSVAIDSQGTVLQHLMELALITGDTALARHAWPGYDRVVGGAWDWGMATAALAGDAAMYAAQRRRAAPARDRPPVGYVLSDVAIGAAASDEIMDLVARTDAGPFVQGMALNRIIATSVQGRPAEARRVALSLPDSLRPVGDLLLATAAIFADGDSVAGAAAVGRLRVLAAGQDVQAAGAACISAYWDLSRTGAATWDEPLLRQRQAHCHAVLEASRAVRERRPDADSLLSRADSMVHALGFGDLNVDQLVLARLWEARGDPRRALAVIRVRTFGLGAVTGEATRCREEGRLAALTGDTAGAVRAYRRYLALRQDAEPVLVPQRDSVRAELARLTGGR